MITKFKLFEYKKDETIFLDNKNILEIIDDLLETDNDILLSIYDAYGDSPLFLLVAEYYKHVDDIYNGYSKEDIFEIIKKLVEKVPEIVDVPNDYYSILTYILQLDKYVDFKLLNYLIDNTNDINQSVDDADTFLEEVVSDFYYQSNKEIVTKLIKKILSKKPDIGLSLIYSIYSCKSNNFNEFDENIIYLLIDAGANWNLKNYSNKTFLEDLDEIDLNLKDKIIKKYPDKYKKYMREQKAKKFKI